MLYKARDCIAKFRKNLSDTEFWAFCLILFTAAVYLWILTAQTFFGVSSARPESHWLGDFYAYFLTAFTLHKGIVRWNKEKLGGQFFGELIGFVTIGHYVSLLGLVHYLEFGSVPEDAFSVSLWIIANVFGWSIAKDLLHPVWKTWKENHHANHDTKTPAEPPAP